MRFAFFLTVMFQFLLYSQDFDQWFVPYTMRVDYYRSANKEKEFLTFDAVYEEGIWPGSRTILLDTLNLGDNLFTVQDCETRKLIASRGFSTLCGEWQTTKEAMNSWRTFHETVRFPFPKRPVVVSFFKRDSLVGKGKTRAFRKLQEFIIDPNDSVLVRRYKPTAAFKVVDVLINGSCDKKVDLLIMGDGYATSDVEKFRADVQHFTKTLFSVSPFAKRKNDFNVRAIEVFSEESGIDKPDIHLWKKNILGTRYNTFGSARYILTEENKTLRDIASAAPYDVITILVNDNRYGGGGIFNLYTTCFTQPVQKGQEWEMDYVYVHELGHCFAGLGDEYYSSQVSYLDFYPDDVEPWEPNLTRTTDRAALKWKEFLSPEIPVPTPWQKEKYDSLEALRGTLNRLSPSYYQERETLLVQARAILNDPHWKGRVGAFEGGGYLPHGMYRPALDCKMFSLNPVDFDPVCSAAIERMIDIYAK